MTVHFALPSLFTPFPPSLLSFLPFPLTYFSLIHFS